MQLDTTTKVSLQSKKAFLTELATTMEVTTKHGKLQCIPQTKAKLLRNVPEVEKNSTLASYAAAVLIYHLVFYWLVLWA